MRNLALAALLTIAGPAGAHIVAVPAGGPAGSYHAVVLRVGHGCGDAATTAIRVELPPGLVTVRPQPKPGWTVAIERMPLATPITLEGRTVKERVATVTWTGNLPADQFDDFAVLLKMPAVAGPIKLPVEQRCGAAVQRWDGSDDRHPAPVVEVTGDAGAQSH